MVAVVITVLWGVILDNGQSKLSDKLIRLHVVANSDDDQDQELKLMVRDNVLEELAQILDGNESKEEAQDKIMDSLDIIHQSAQMTVSNQGFDSTVNVSIIESEHFPTREYDTFSLPAGNYTSLRVEIGQAQGQNWWCVVFPPLCMEAAEGESDIEASDLSDEEVALITEADSGYVIKFKALELLDEIKTIFNN